MIRLRLISCSLLPPFTKKPSKRFCLWGLIFQKTSHGCCWLSIHLYNSSCTVTKRHMCNCLHFLGSIFIESMLPKNCLMKPAFALQTKKQQPECDYVSVTPVTTQSLRCQLQPLIHYKQNYCG